MQISSISESDQAAIAKMLRSPQVRLPRKFRGPRMPAPIISGGGDIGVAFIFDGAGAVLSSSLTGALWIPDAETINAVTLLALPSAGDLQVTISKGTYAGYPSGSNICGAYPPFLSSAQKYQDTTLTGWTTQIDAGDCLVFGITGTPTVIKWAACILGFA